jgi:hypothetical protein
MNKELTEEEMRQALFGNASISAPVSKVAEKRASKTFTPRLRVTLGVSNEFEGKTFEIVHEADTLSTLLAEQEATKVARKKYRYVEVVSVKPM